MEASAAVPIQSVEWPQGWRTIAALILVVGLITAGGYAYLTTRTPITLVIDGQARSVHTHQETVGALLMDLGLELGPKDAVMPANLETALTPGQTVEVRRARPVYVHADGHSLLLYTHATTVEGVLREARVSLLPQDEVDVSVEWEKATRMGNTASRPDPIHVTVHRAVPFTLHEDGKETTVHTTASTVGEALRRIGVTLYLADGVQPGLGDPLSAGLHVSIQRSIPVAVHVDGHTLRARTHRDRVDQVLADLGIVLTGQDYTTPTLEATLREDATIRVVRVRERFVTEQEPIPFETAWQPDPDLEIDNERLLQEGVPGILERRVRLRYEDGHEVARSTDGEYVAVPPTTKIYGYGTKIIVRTLNTPSGPVEYWRKLRMLATSYSAGTAGTPVSSPYYGRTATGMQMRHGIVAVDPRVISLGSQVYVPSYGVGLAGDTGGAIKWNRIDLGYDDDNLVLWYRWVDVYLLTPVPENVNYVLN